MDINLLKEVLPEFKIYESDKPVGIPDTWEGKIIYIQCKKCEKTWCVKLEDIPKLYQPDIDDFKGHTCC